MTDDSMAFQAWLEQHGGEDFLRGLMERLPQRLMERFADNVGSDVV